jgi:hypothetical protein
MNSIAKHTQLLNRFPKFELSYETVSHKKVSMSDSVAIAISLGRKYFIWYTHKCGGSEDACYLIGLDKDKQIYSVENRQLTKITPSRFCLGTVLYGTLYEHPDSTNSVFISEDIYYHCGTNVSNLCFGDRIGFLRDFAINADANSQNIVLPIMWYVNAGDEQTAVIPQNMASQFGYVPHHIQYRDIRRVAPYINVSMPKRGAIPSSIVAQVSSATVAQKITATSIMNPIPRFDYSKSTYRYPAVFNITADPQLDLYHLYAYGGPGVSSVYCGLAGIQSLKTSMFMNKIFRHVRENDNLDLAEESEDESDFENMDVNKHVNLDAIVPMECVFNNKHKKWTPVRLVGKMERIIHVDKLVQKQNNNCHQEEYQRFSNIDAKFRRNDTRGLKKEYSGNTTYNNTQYSNKNHNNSK